MRVIIFSILFIPSIIGICYCPRECIEYKDCSSYNIDRRICEDNEANKECNNANDELTDMVDSIGRNADLYLIGKLYNKELTPKQVSILRTKLSFALEENKPVGDCESGLSTNKLIKGTNSWCYSESLLDECVRIKNSSANYTLSISEILQESINETNTNITLNNINEFIDIIKQRTGILTGKIRCAAYESTIEDINASDKLSISLISFILILFSIKSLL